MKINNLKNYLNIFIVTTWVLFSSTLFASETSCKDYWKQGLIQKNLHTYQRPQSGETFTNQKNQNYKSYYESLNRMNCKKDWTILVYMQADNDLEPYALWDLYEMESSFKKRLTGSTVKTDLVVQLDTYKTKRIRRLHMFQADEKYNKNLQLEDFQNKTEEDIHSPTVQFINEVEESKRSQREDFNDFIKWGMKKYPAKNYFVVIWGHGQGWGNNSAVQFGGIAFDDSQKSKLLIPDIVSSLKDNPVSLLASDACLMQTIEVATELSSVTDYTIGSTQIHNYLGLPYRRLLYELNSGSFLGLKKKLQTEDEPYIMSKMIPILFKKSFDPNRGLQGRIDKDGIKTITMSSVSSSQLRNNLIPALSSLGDSLIKFTDEDPFRAQMFKMGLESSPKFLGGSRDIGTLLGYIKEFVSESPETKITLELESKLNKALDALNQTLMQYSYGTEYQSYSRISQYFIGFFKAFGILMPTSNAHYEKYSSKVKESSLYKDFMHNSWSKWLDGLYAPMSSSSLPFEPIGLDI